VSDIEYVYADGASFRDGMIGTWAWCHVNTKNERVAEASGVVHRDDFARTVQAHHMEILALLHGLEALPDRWAGVARSDSQSTLRVLSGQKLGRIPMPWATRIIMTRRRLGKFTLEWVRGHPRFSDLANGHRFGVPVSEHNVYVDRRCHEESVRWFKDAVESHQPIVGAWSWWAAS
jgi:ribonuclease HI